MTRSATSHIERIVAFPSQQWLHERATVLHYMYFDYGFAWRRCRYVNQNHRLKFRWKMDRRRSHLTQPTAHLAVGLREVCRLCDSMSDSTELSKIEMKFIQRRKNCSTRGTVRRVTKGTCVQHPKMC